MSNAGRLSQQRHPATATASPPRRHEVRHAQNMGLWHEAIRRLASDFDCSVRVATTALELSIAAREIQHGRSVTAWSVVDKADKAGLVARLVAYARALLRGDEMLCSQCEHTEHLLQAMQEFQSERGARLARCEPPYVPRSVLSWGRSWDTMWYALQQCPTDTPRRLCRVCVRVRACVVGRGLLVASDHTHTHTVAGQLEPRASAGSAGSARNQQMRIGRAASDELAAAQRATDGTALLPHAGRQAGRRRLSVCTHGVTARLIVAP